MKFLKILRNFFNSAKNECQIIGTIPIFTVYIDIFYTGANELRVRTEFSRYQTRNTKKNWSSRLFCPLTA